MSAISMQWSIFEIDAAETGPGGAGRRRPVLVVSREAANAALPIVTVLPLAAYRRGRRVYPNEVLLPSALAGLGEDTVAMAHQTVTIPKRQLSAPLAAIRDPDLRSAIRNAMRVQLNLEELESFRVDE